MDGTVSFRRRAAASVAVLGTLFAGKAFAAPQQTDYSQNDAYVYSNADASPSDVASGYYVNERICIV